MSTAATASLPDKIRRTVGPLPLAGTLPEPYDTVTPCAELTRK